MVDESPSIAHFKRDTTIAIPSFMFMEYGFYQLFIVRVFIAGSHAFEMVVENGASHLS